MRTFKVERFWNEERVETLKARWAEGKTSTQIALAMGGLTRNAVIGKLSRLGLMSHQPRAKQRANRRLTGFITRDSKNPLKKKAIDKAGGIYAYAEKMVEKHPKAKVLGPLPPPAPVIGRKAFAELEEADCKFPVGDSDFRFCALPRVEGQPYCQSCCQIAFAPRVARQAPAASPARSFLQFERA